MEFNGGVDVAHQIVIRGTPAENLATLDVSLNSGDGFIALRISINFSSVPISKEIYQRTLNFEILYSETRISAHVLQACVQLLYAVKSG